MTDRIRALGPLEGRVATLFVVAGGLFVVFAAFHGVEAFTNRSAPKDVFGPAGFAFAFAGLLGLSRELVDRSPWLSRFGAIFATLGVTAAAITSVWHVGLWVFPTATPAYVTALSIGMVLGQFLGYTSFGLAGLRTGVHSRSTGLLLLAVPAILAVMIGTVAAGYATSGSAVVLGSAQALVHVVIGISLRAEGVPADRTKPSAEPTAK